MSNPSTPRAEIVQIALQNLLAGIQPQEVLTSLADIYGRTAYGAYIEAYGLYQGQRNLPPSAAISMGPASFLPPQPAQQFAIPEQIEALIGQVRTNGQNEQWRHRVDYIAGELEDATRARIMAEVNAIVGLINARGDYIESTVIESLRYLA